MQKMREQGLLTVVFTLLFITQGSCGQVSEPGSSCTNFETLDNSKSRGVITSPSYPLYEANSTCKIWYFVGQDDNDVVTISFVDYDIPTKSPWCTEGSYLSLGPSPMHYVCGTMGNSSVASSYSYAIGRHRMWIEYQVTDSTTEPPGRGFKLEYIQGPSGADECLTDEIMCFDNSKCILEKWQCNGAQECSDGTDEDGCDEDHIKHMAPPENYSCGDGFGCQSASDGQYRCFPQRFICDGSPQCQDGRDEHKCDHSEEECTYDYHSQPYGHFTSANYPNFYPEDNKCTYKVRVDQGKRVQLRFPDFRLGKGDTLYIYDGSSASNNILDVYSYSSNPPKALTASGDTVFVEFRSNNDGNVGHGFNITYQIKGICIDKQFSCKYGNEDECYEQSQHCNNVWDCPLHGGDERGCDTCSDGLFSCSGSSHCYEEKDHCNGLHFCPDKSDEEGCTELQCNHGNGTFLCDNKRCIYESWVCDRADDCKDNSDEKDCPNTPSRKVITAAVLGSLLCALLLTVAIGFTCQLHARRMNQMLGGYARYMSPMSRVEQEIWARQSAPPLYDEAMRTSRPFEEAQREFMQALQQAMDQRTANGGVNSSHTAATVNAANSTNGNDNPNQNNNARPNSSATDDDPLLDLAQADDCILGAALTTDQEDDASNVLISINTGAKAQWRRSRSKTRSGTSVTDDGPSRERSEDVTQLQILNSCDISALLRRSSGGNLQSDTNIDNIDPSNVSDTSTTNNTASPRDKPIDPLQTDNAPMQIINKSQKGNGDHEGDDVQSLDDIRDLDDDADDYDAESISQNSASSAFIAHQPLLDAGHLLAGKDSGANRPLDNASVAGSSDISGGDWPESGGSILLNKQSGDGDISMLSLD